MYANNSKMGANYLKKLLKGSSCFCGLRNLRVIDQREFDHFYLTIQLLK